MRSRSVASPGSRWLSAYAALVYAFLYLPIVVLAVYSFNAGGVGGFPPRNLTLSWYRILFQDDAIWRTLLNSFIVALVAVAISIILGLMAALALEEGACLPVIAVVAAVPLVAAVAEPARPAPSSVPAMARHAPAAASLGAVSLGTMEIRMKSCLPSWMR